MSHRVKGTRLPGKARSVKGDWHERRRGGVTGVWDSTVLGDPLLERDSFRMDGVTALFAYFITQI